MLVVFEVQYLAKLAYSLLVETHITDCGFGFNHAMMFLKFTKYKSMDTHSYSVIAITIS